MKNLLKRIKWLPVLFAGFLLLSDCHKDKVINNQPTVSEDDPCYPDMVREPMSGWITKGTGNSYGWPDYNPNNRDEFVCIEYPPANSNAYKLIAYNILTHKKTLLATGSFLYQPKWGSSGWIVFTAFPDEQLWLVKSDGSKWKQLTNDPPGSSHYFPDWSPDGTKIVFNYGQSVSKANIRIIDTSGTVIKDFIQGEFGGPCLWAPDGYNIAGGNRIINYLTNQYIDIGSNEVQRWFPDQKSWITFDTTGIYVYPSQTDTRQLIKGSCSTRQYNFFSVSNDGKQILSGRNVTQKLDSITLKVSAKIVIMNADGSNAQAVKMDW